MSTRPRRARHRPRDARASSCSPDYYEVLARLRAEAPVFEYAPGIKAVTRYHDIREISRDPATFCSGRGVLVNDPLREGGTVDGSILHMDPPRARRVAPHPQPRVHRPGGRADGGRDPRARGPAARRDPAGRGRRPRRRARRAAAGAGDLRPARRARRGPRRLPALVRRDDPRHRRPVRAAAGGASPTSWSSSRSSSSWPRDKPANPARRHRVAARRRRGRRPPARRRRAGDVQHVAARRGQRDDPAPDLGRDDGAGRAPRPAGRARRRSRRDPGRGRGVPALGHADPAVRPHGRRATPRSAASRSPRTTTW